MDHFMKIIGISCSPRKGKTTYYTLQQCLNFLKLKYREINTDIIDLGGLNISGCVNCENCKEKLDCSIKDDFIDIIPKLVCKDVKGIIIATPVYLGSMTALCKAFIDRTVMFIRNGFLLRNKIGGVLAVGGVRNGGQEITIQAVQAAMLCHDMIIVGDGNNTSHFGGTVWSNIKGGVVRDETGLRTVYNLGYKVAELVLKLNKDEG